jgi:hypothetical protein
VNFAERVESILDAVATLEIEAESTVQVSPNVY